MKKLGKPGSATVRYARGPSRRASSSVIPSGPVSSIGRRYIHLLPGDFFEPLDLVMTEAKLEAVPVLA
jgi:hypothetical protein